MENVLAFLRAAAPWISLGLLVAFFCVRPAVKKGKSEYAESDYAVDGMCIGMCIGMCVGMTVGSLIGNGNGGLGTSLGMLIGLAIGLSIPRKSEKGQQQKKGQK